MAVGGKVMREYYGVIDRDNDDGVAWGPGPWDGEPDKVEWMDETTGLPCLAVRGRVGSWCGYVGLPPDHPDHGMDYNSLDSLYDVHGGLTFSDHCMKNQPIERAVCHVTDGDDDVWWLGFDTIHFNDIAPQMEAFTRHMRELRPEYPWLDAPDLPGMFRRSYKTLAYVQAEVANLAQQVAARAADG